MARGKKKEELTLEEKLEQALVPVEEQPYEVPGNWCWVRLDHVCEIAMGQSPSGIDVTDDENCTPLIGGASDMGELYPLASRYTKVSTKLSKKDDIIVCIRATLGNPIYSDGEYCLGRGVAGIRAICCGKEYLRYFFKAFEQYLYDNATGTTFVQVTGKVLNKMPFPLPPLAEQQRIIERIEFFFAKLDEVKEKLQEVMEGYAIREASILQKAVSGELTQAWREQNGILRSGWKTISLKDCGTWFGGGTPTTSKKEYWDEGTIPWITSKDMKDRLIEDSLLHVTQTGVNNSSARYCDKPAVLFVMRSGILRRILPVCMVKVPFTVNQDLKAVIPEKIQQEYLYWACTAYEKDIRENCMKSGTTVESIEAKKLLDYKLPLPCEKEQKVIVDVVENLMHKEESVKQVVIQILEKIDIMKKSILAKAFRGKLGTNNSDEESAIELLKALLMEA